MLWVWIMELVWGCWCWFISVCVCVCVCEQTAVGSFRGLADSGKATLHTSTNSTTQQNKHKHRRQRERAEASWEIEFMSLMKPFQSCYRNEMSCEWKRERAGDLLHTLKLTNRFSEVKLPKDPPVWERQNVVQTVTRGGQYSKCLSIYLAICLSLCHSKHLSVCLSFYHSKHLSVCHSKHLSVCRSIILNVCLSVCHSKHLSVCLSVVLSF